MHFPAESALHLGGPDRPPRYLRDLLQARIEAVPAGGAIHWATYYFCDMDLANTLMAAHDRGVRVHLALEAEPRHAQANAAVVARLCAHGLGGGLYLNRPRPVGPYGHLHAKIYAFSHPARAALVGSFNPSCNIPEDADVIADIGDQDRGHNVLAELHDAPLVERLCAYVESFAPGRQPWWRRLSKPQNTVLHSGGVALYFFPRILPHVVTRELDTLAAPDRVRGVISHLKPGPLIETLARAVRRGTQVELIVHDTERRVPGRTVQFLLDAGVQVRRYRHPDHLPVHAKFLLVERGNGTVAYLGSFNFNPRSLYLNHELLVRTGSAHTVAGLVRRFDDIAAEVAAQRGESTPCGRL